LIFIEASLRGYFPVVTDSQSQLDRASTQKTNFSAAKDWSILQVDNFSRKHLIIRSFTKPSTQSLRHSPDKIVDGSK
jgi:hypothetical protein